MLLRKDWEKFLRSILSRRYEVGAMSLTREQELQAAIDNLEATNRHAKEILARALADAKQAGGENPDGTMTLQHQFNEISRVLTGEHRDLIPAVYRLLDKAIQAKKAAVDEIIKEQNDGMVGQESGEGLVTVSPTEGAPAEEPQPVPVAG